MGGGPVVQRWPCGAVGPRAGQEEEEAEELHICIVVTRRRRLFSRSAVLAWVGTIVAFG
jgi:hypothetical protein